ncbi:hypothetical protein Ahy_B03g066177 [Arachis hypogaea]|uniref:Transposase MuDR plant domain-containing protein n=1 Tax=Arachis hypogaea TaxID=3818 RepID=A0A445A3M5_ARAHY|nr:hypothetical protein Ahy_B03g066177 [Arachis hypogaea]
MILMMHLAFREGARFGESHLEVGMKFGIKWEFREVSRRIRLKKNDIIRCITVCKVKECPGMIYALRDYDNTCWQIKTFNDNHTCLRNDRNKATKRN